MQANSLNRSPAWRPCCCLSAPVLLLVAGFSTASLYGQTLQPGATIPVRLQNTLNSERDLPGKTFTLKTTQDVPLNGHHVLRKGAKITGHILAAQSLKKGERDSRLVLELDTLEFSRQQTSIVVGLRAMASVLEVQGAGTPTNADENSAAWTTQQIGGDIVYRGGGPVTASWGETVGKPLNDGVMSRLLAPRNELVLKGMHCAPSDKLHALGLFASTACAVYGFPSLTIEHDGFDKPKGQIALVSQSQSVKIRAGSQFLLQALGP